MTAMFTPWKTEEPLRGMELKGKKEGKIKRKQERSLERTFKIKDVY